MPSEFKYEVVEHIATLSTSAKGWTKELNLISWNDREPKYDIREWSPNKEKMGKGVTLSDEEVRILRKALDGRDDIKERNGHGRGLRKPDALLHAVRSDPRFGLPLLHLMRRRRLRHGETLRGGARGRSLDLERRPHYLLHPDSDLVRLLPALRGVLRRGRGHHRGDVRADHGGGRILGRGRLGAPRHPEPRRGLPGDLRSPRPGVGALHVQRDPVQDRPVHSRPVRHHLLAVLRHRDRRPVHRDDALQAPVLALHLPTAPAEGAEPPR